MKFAHFSREVELISMDHSDPTSTTGDEHKKIEVFTRVRNEIEEFIKENFCSLK